VSLSIIIRAGNKRANARLAEALWLDDLIDKPTPMGRISSGPARGSHRQISTTRNLVAGTTLYMPVHAPGALFSAGGRGTPLRAMARVDLNRDRDRVCAENSSSSSAKDMKLTWPRAETPTHWIVMGLHTDLDEGMKIAVRETIDLITKRFPHLTREEAYMIAERGRGLSRHAGGRWHQGRSTA